MKGTGDHANAPTKVLSQKDLDKLLDESARIPCVLKFTAEFCGPCKAIQPKVREISRRFSGKARMFEVDVEECEELAVNLGITSIPAFYVFVNRKKVKEFLGLNVDSLEEFLSGTVGS